MNIPQVEIVPVDQLKVDGRNPNVMTSEQEKALQKNIQKYGFIVPVITNREYLVADGEHRLQAAKSLGMKEVAVIRLDVSEVDRQMLRQVLNKLKGQHDRGKDAIEFKAILEAGMGEELLSLLGRTDTKLVQFMASVKPNPVNEQEIDIEKSLQAPVYDVQTGDVWEMGNHRLVCGDSTNPANYDLLLGAGEKAGMIFTDPPYNVAYGSGDKFYNDGRGKPEWYDRRANDAHAILNDSLSKEDWKKFVDSFMGAMLPRAKGGVYICMSTKEWPTVMNSFEANGGHWSSTIIWVKDRFVLGRKDYHTQFEPILRGNEINQIPPDSKGNSILYGWKEGDSHDWYGEREQSDVWFMNRPNVNDLHPTMKPVGLVQRALMNSSYPGDVVLDPFAGSGTTVIACEELGRIAAVMEIDPRYCSIILDRWAKATGKTPINRQRTDPLPPHDGRNHA